MKKRIYFKKYYQIYLILVPAILYFFIFNYIPMFGLTLAFRDYRFDKGLLFSEWIGFDYFVAFFNYYNSWNIIRNTVIISFFKLVVFFPIPIIFAIMVDMIKGHRFKRFIQTVSYLPHFVSWVVAITIMQQFFSLGGFVNQIRGSLGLDSIFFLNEADYFYLFMFLSYVWKATGWSAIIYIAAISGIDPTLYEAAKVDGANKLKQVWHITLPSIMPVAALLFVLGLADILNAGWDQIYLLRQPGNMELSEILDTYVIQQGFRGGQIGYATAVSLLQSVIGLILVLTTNWIIKRRRGFSIF